MTSSAWWWVAAGGLALGALVWGGLAARRRRRTLARRRAPLGYGAVLAHALDGHLDHAVERLEGLLREGAIDPADGALGLVALYRAAGSLASAEALLENLTRRGVQGTWLLALRARIALDRGDLRGACALVDANPGVPLDLCLAALCRAGRWADALALYRVRRGRRDRDPTVEAALLSGLALDEAGAGNERAARRALKKALASDEESLLPTLAGAWLHGKPSERVRFATVLAARLGPGAGILLPASSIEPTAVEADAEVEVVLGQLRDAIERDPRDWDARRAYATLLLEHGEPDDWRRELAEVLACVAGDDLEATTARCARCDFVAPRPFFVCPRCDALGSATAGGKAGDSSGRAVASVEGAKISDMLTNLRGFRPTDHG